MRSRIPFSLLYRTFYYDAEPYGHKGHTPIGGRPVDWSGTEQAVFRRDLFDVLRASPNVAVRLGEVRRDGNRAWILHEQARRDLLAGRRAVADLTDGDFAPALRQKGVDMRIGLDIATITLKRQASIIVLVSGDADFVPAAKLARREGVQFILDPLWQRIPPDLSEHIDGLRSGFYLPRHRNGPASEE
ncbi:MAG: NYN domain-containing protein [bacterium]|nr:NYN domain-containing protein [bacterium]